MICEANSRPFAKYLAFILAIVLIVIGLHILDNPESVGRGRMRLSGAALQVQAVLFASFFIAIGIACARQGWKRIKSTDPVVRIDEQGIYWSQWSSAPIPWSNIERVLVGTETAVPYLKLYLRDPAISLPDDKRVAFEARARRSALHEDLYLAFAGLLVDREKLAQTVHWHLAGKHHSQVFA